MHQKTIRIPVEITFSTDPAELDDREGETPPTGVSLVAYLKDAMRLEVDTEGEGQPEGAVFAAAGVDWDAAELVDEDDGHEQAINALLAKAEATGLKPEDLDEIVHELTASIAADVNNSGMDGQIGYLIDQMDVQGATKQIDRLVEERSEAREPTKYPERENNGKDHPYPGRHV